MKKTYFPYKPASKMNGPFVLSLPGVKSIPQKPGVYLLLRKGKSGNLLVRYVGRSDRNLHRRLGVHVDEKQYSHFYYVALSDAVAAFRKECREFHRYGKSKYLDNERHPARPRGYADRLAPCTEVGCNGEAN